MGPSSQTFRGRLRLWVELGPPHKIPLGAQYGSIPVVKYQFWLWTSCCGPMRLHGLRMPLGRVAAYAAVFNFGYFNWQSELVVCGPTDRNEYELGFWMPSSILTLSFTAQHIVRGEGVMLCFSGIGIPVAG